MEGVTILNEFEVVTKTVFSWEAFWWGALIGAIIALGAGIIFGLQESSFSAFIFMFLIMAIFASALIGFLAGYKICPEPVELKWFPTYYEDKGYEYYIEHFASYQLETKLPARREGDYDPVICPDLPRCLERIATNHKESLDKWLTVKAKNMTMSKWVNPGDIGLSTCATQYTMPEEQRQLLIEYGYRIED